MGDVRRQNKLSKVGRQKVGSEAAVRLSLKKLGPSVAQCRLNRCLRPYLKWYPDACSRYSNWPQ